MRSDQVDRLQYVNKIRAMPPRELTPDELADVLPRQRTFMTEQLPPPLPFALDAPPSPDEDGPDDDPPRAAAA